MRRARSVRYDLVVVGGGSAGLVAAEFAARIGARVALVEKGRLGGDCLWTGCVPSKTLLAEARHGQDDPAAVWRRIRSVQEQIAATDDNPERYRALGVEVVEGRARLAGPHVVDIEGQKLETRFVLLCTGSRPAAPPIDGLDEAGYLTSETLWGIERPPSRLIVIGGGPIGCELAQAFARLGCLVTLLEALPRLLPEEEPELVEILERVLRKDGVEIHTGVPAERVTVEDGRKIVLAAGQRLEADELIVATGRRPNVDELGVDAAGVDVGERGIVVDEHLRTTARSVYAAGDVAGRYLFTHSAAQEAAIAVRNMFFPGGAKAPELVPSCTFTDPELAHVGLTLGQAQERHRDVRAWRIGLERSDRARAEGATAGGLLLVTARERLVGAHVLAPAAGEVIHELVLAIARGLRLRDLASIVHVYPTVSTSVAQLASDAAFERAERYAGIIRRLPGI